LVSHAVFTLTYVICPRGCELLSMKSELVSV